jgi:hypothetical protein
MTMMQSMQASIEQGRREKDDIGSAAREDVDR